MGRSLNICFGYKFFGEKLMGFIVTSILFLKKIYIHKCYTKEKSK